MTHGTVIKRHTALFDNDQAIVIVLHSITVVCPRLLTVSDSVVLFFFSFFSFFLILYGAPAMSLT